MHAVDAAVEVAVEEDVVAEVEGQSHEAGVVFRPRPGRPGTKSARTIACRTTSCSIGRKAESCDPTSRWRHWGENGEISSRWTSEARSWHRTASRSW